MNLEELVYKLKAIARLNGDAFYYHIDIQPNKAFITYQFVCEETADGHWLVEGSGSTIEEAVNDAARQVDSAVLDWGYKLP